MLQFTAFAFTIVVEATVAEVVDINTMKVALEMMPKLRKTIQLESSNHVLTYFIFEFSFASITAKMIILIFE